MTEHRTRLRTSLRIIAIVALGAAVGLFARPHIDELLHRGPIPAGEPTAPPSEPEWVNLLDAEHASNWKNLGDELDIFELNDGVLHIHGRTIYPLRYVTYTGQTFADFDLHLEFKVARSANSGVFLRTKPNDAVNRGFEIQVLDDFGNPPTKNGCGAIYDIATPMFNMSRPHGDWNSYDISVVGKTVKVTMNGWKIIDTDLGKMTSPLGKFPIAYNDLPLEGNLALQDHGGEAWYRNVLVRPRTR